MIKVVVTLYIKDANGKFATKTRTIEIFPAKKPGTSGYWLYNRATDIWFNTQTEPCDEIVELFVTFMYRRHLAIFEKLIKIISITRIQ